jgi:guanylate cyclase, other
VEQINRYKSCDEIEGFKKRARSLIVVVSTPPETKYSNFTEQVRTYNHAEPFNAPKANFPGKRFETFISIYAAYLYDSVMLYANALDRLLKGKQQELKRNISSNYLPNLPEEIIKEIASNGTEIIAEIIRQKKYLSITGAEIIIDNNGDSEGNFSVLVLKPEPFSAKDSNFSCSLHMRPIATFQGSGSGDSLPVSDKRLW